MIYTSSIYICTASAQNAELKVMGVFEVRIWSGAGVSASLYTGISVWDGLVVVWCVSVDTTILHTFLSEPACTACTNIVYSKELERDDKTTVKALLRLKTLA